MMEHRQRRRHRTFTLVEIKDNNQHDITGLAYNVSRDGIFVLSTTAPKVNITVDICISIPAKEKLLKPISGIVVHRSKNGFGLMFCKQNGATWLLVEELLNGYMELELTKKNLFC